MGRATFETLPLTWSPPARERQILPLASTQKLPIEPASRLDSRMAVKQDHLGRFYLLSSYLIAPAAEATFKLVGDACGIQSVEVSFAKVNVVGQSR